MAIIFQTTVGKGGPMLRFSPKYTVIDEERAEWGIPGPGKERG